MSQNPFVQQGTPRVNLNIFFFQLRGLRYDKIPRIVLAPVYNP